MRGGGTRSFLALLLACIALLIAGCPSSGPRFDAWTGFSKCAEEPPDFAAYTYVLFGRNLDISPDGEVELLYSRTLEAIVAFTDDLDEFAFPPSETNLFAIPIENQALGPDLVNYDFQLSREMLSSIVGIDDMRALVANRIRLGEGPFLVTTTSRIRDMSSPDQCVLFADLSGSRPEAVQETLKRYRMQISGEPGECRQFESLSISILNTMLFGNLFLAEIINIDVSSWFGLFEQEPKEREEDEKKTESPEAGDKPAANFSPANPPVPGARASPGAELALVHR